MSRVTSLKKKRLQHKLDRERSKINHALRRRRHPRKHTLNGNLYKVTPKRRAAA